MEVSHLTFLAFTIFSSLRVVSYIPQIAKVASDTHGATAISYSTWSLWTGANAATALYALINLNDLYLAAVSAVYSGCCIVVIALTTIKRRRLKDGVRMARDGATRRGALARNIQTHVTVEGSALLSGARPHYAFERELAYKSRQLIWHDLTGLFWPRQRGCKRTTPFP
jgi:hypothetical protein